jgi:hypothetical protein
MAESVFKWIKDGDVLVAVNTAGKISDEVWAKFMADFAACRCHIGASLGILEVSSVQRREAAEVIRANKMAVAVITDDILVRGVVTAVSWLGANARSFAWKDIDRAFERLGLLDRKDQLMPHIDRLREACIAEHEERRRQRRTARGE